MKGVITLRLFYNGKCIKAMSKGKTIESKSKGILIAKYKFDCSKADLFPEFNEGFEYTFVDEQVDERDVMSIDRETVTVMTYDAEPDEYGILTTEYEVETPVLINAGDIITRSIYSNDLPTKVRFENCEGLLELLYLNISKLTTFRKIFNKCRNVTSINTNGWDTSKVTEMSYMFYDCENLTALDLNNFDTSNVDSMSYMFTGCNKLTALDLSSFDTSKVTGMYAMFNGCDNLTTLDLSNFDTSKVIDVGYMFSGCKNLKNLNIANFDLNKTTGLDNLFTSCNKLDYIDCSNIDAYSVKMISGLLLNRTNKSAGTIVCKTVLETDTLNALSSRNWNIT